METVSVTSHNGPKLRSFDAARTNLSIHKFRNKTKFSNLCVYAYMQLQISVTCLKYIFLQYKNQP